MKPLAGFAISLGLCLGSATVSAQDGAENRGRKRADQPAVKANLPANKAETKDDGRQAAEDEITTDKHRQLRAEARAAMRFVSSWVNEPIEYQIRRLGSRTDPNPLVEIEVRSTKAGHAAVAGALHLMALDTPPRDFQFLDAGGQVIVPERAAEDRFVVKYDQVPPEKMRSLQEFLEKHATSRPLTRRKGGLLYVEARADIHAMIKAVVEAL